MKSLWPEEFKAKDVKPAKQILEEQALLLPKLTGDMVFARVINMSRAAAVFTNHEEKDFRFSFVMRGKFLKNYSFKILDFSHEITLYPTQLTLDELIASEIGLEQEIMADSEDNLKLILGKILVTERIKDIIGSIIRISSSKSA